MSNVKPPPTFTGRQVRALRSSLRFKPEEFASLLGVHVATVYRWEEAPQKTPRIEPLQREILRVLSTQLRLRAWHDLSTSLLGAFERGGTLEAIATLVRT